MDEVYLEVISPADGRRCPVWIDGGNVVGQCGPISTAVPIYVMGPPGCMGKTVVLKILYRLGYKKATVEEM